MNCLSARLSPTVSLWQLNCYDFEYEHALVSALLWVAALALRVRVTVTAA